MIRDDVLDLIEGDTTTDALELVTAGFWQRFGTRAYIADLRDPAALLALDLAHRLDVGHRGRPRLDDPDVDVDQVLDDDVVDQDGHR